MRKTSLVDKLTVYLDEKKAEDIQKFVTKDRTPFFDNVVLASVTSARQLDSLAENVKDFLEENKQAIHHIEGTIESGWIIIDAYDIVINLFTKEERSRINLDEIFE